MNDTLLSYDVKMIDISHHNSKNSDGYSTHITLIKQSETNSDSEQIHIVVYSKKEIQLRLQSNNE